MINNNFKLGDDKVFWGVCDGLSNYFEINVVVIRLIALILFAFWPVEMFMIYIIIMLCMTDWNNL